MRKNDRRSPLVNNSMAMSSNMNLPQRHRGEVKSRSSEDNNIVSGETKLQAHRGRSSPNLSGKKSLVTRSVTKSGAYRQVVENSTYSKNKGSKKPPLMKSPSAATVLSKTYERINQLNNKKVKCHCDPFSEIGSDVVEDDLDSHLFTGTAYEQTLLELNLLPGTLSLTPEKSETVPTSTLKGFQTFDGSRFSPIEEAFFVLNSSTADLCANVFAEKVAETVYPEYEYPVNVYQNPFQTEIWQRTSEESVSDGNCFTCTSEESSTKWSTFSSSETCSVLQTAKRLADFEIPWMVRKIQALEEELMEVKQQNKKLERLLKVGHRPKTSF